MSEMVERVAKALYSEDPEDWDDALRIVNGTFGGEGFMQQHPDTQANYKADMDEARDKARRAIEAMREPTAAMLEAEPEDDGEFSKENSIFHARQFWQAMIGAALSRS